MRVSNEDDEDGEDLGTNEHEMQEQNHEGQATLIVENA